MTEKKNTQNNNLMKDKLGVIMCLANERSLAWGIAESLYASQANIILTYQGEVLGKRVKPLSQKINSPAIFECDVSDETSIQHTFETIEKEYGKIGVFRKISIFFFLYLVSSWDHIYAKTDAKR